MADLFKMFALPVKTPTETLVAGTVDFYHPGTTGESNRKDVYTDSAGTIVAANPYTLGADATATLYGVGLYHIVIKDSAGNVEYDYDYITADQIFFMFNPLTLAELEQFTGYEGAVAQLFGRVTQADGGEGTFYWSTANLSTEVAGDTEQGIYVAPDSDPTGASGAWVRRFSGAVNVKWFGAKGDGATDDTAAVEGARDTLAAEVFFPAGTYVVSQVFHNVDHQSWRGEGKGKTTITKANGDALHVIWIDGGTDGASLRDLTVDGNRANNDSSGASVVPDVYAIEAINLTFDNVEFKNADYYNLYLDGCHQADGKYQHRITDCSFSNFRFGGIGLSYSNASTGQATGNTLIDNCDFIDNINPAGGSSSCIWAVQDVLGAVPGPRSVQISNCRAQNIVDSLLICNAFDGITVTGCVASVAGAMVYTGSGGVTPRGQNLVITGNQFQSTLDGCLGIDSTDNFVVSDNIIHDTWGEGMLVFLSANGVIRGNVVYNCGTSGTRAVGINITDDSVNISERIVITGNICYDTETGANRTQEYGIYLNADTDLCTIQGNICYNNIIADIAQIDERQNSCQILNNLQDIALDVDTGITADTDIDWTWKTTQFYKLAASAELTFKNAHIGQTYKLILTSVGNFNITAWNHATAGFKWLGGVAPTITNGTGAQIWDTFEFFYDGFNFYEVNRQQNMK